MTGRSQPPGATEARAAEQAWMDEAIRLAEQARGRTGDNPWVGCVIVRGGEVLGRGFTHPPGKDHAEAAAIRQAHEAGVSLAGATLVCTLEPCSFEGRTPACARTIADSGVVRVVFGIRDPHPRVNGAGVRILREAGVEVCEGLRQQEIRAQLAEWLSGHASSLDA